MRTKTVALLITAAMTSTACGAVDAGDDIQPPSDPDAPLVQIVSEGGFAPVEMILGNGPRYTLLADGRLIYQGPVPEIFPGPLIPNYQVTTIDEEQMNQVLELVNAIGLPDFEERLDDSQASMVADATTEVITYWDENGEHRYAVYALGIDTDQRGDSATEAFGDLLDLFGELAIGEAEPYEPDEIRVIAGPGFVNEEFEDIRAWPLQDTDLPTWDRLPNGWQCKVFGSDVLDTFSEATHATVWSNPDPDLPNSYLKLLVRPLHPGEEPCPTS